LKAFDQVWSSVARTSDGEAVLSDLKPLVFRVYDDATAQPAGAYKKHQRHQQTERGFQRDLCRSFHGPAIINGSTHSRQSHPERSLKYPSHPLINS
jgi:hypothetical protein